MNLDKFLSNGLITRVPGLVIGPPGVGKTAAIVNWGRRNNLRTWTIVASLREPTDFAGLPVISDQVAKDPKTGKTFPTVHFAPPSFAKEASEHGGLIFLDEITTAPPAVQAALLRAVLDLAFGDLELPPDRVAIVAAANPPELSAGGCDLAPPLANRFRHRTFQLETRDWVESFPTYWDNVPKLVFGEKMLDADEWSKARALVAGFIRTRPTKLLEVPQDETKRGQAWPSPRTWDFASRQIAAVTMSGSNLTEAVPYVADCVGDGIAVELMAWCKEANLPDPRDLLAEPDKFKVPERMDVTFAIMSALTAVVISDLTVPNWKAVWKIIRKVIDKGAKDIVAPSAALLVSKYKPSLPKPVDELREFSSLMKSSGIMSN